MSKKEQTNGGSEIEVNILKMNVDKENNIEASKEDARMLRNKCFRPHRWKRFKR